MPQNRRLTSTFLLAYRDARVFGLLANPQLEAAVWHVLSRHAECDYELNGGVIRVGVSQVRSMCNWTQVPKTGLKHASKNQYYAPQASHSTV